MCEQCLEAHFRENIGIEDALKKIDYDRHTIMNVVPYITNKMTKALKMLNDVCSQYFKINRICSMVNNYDKLIDYNYHYLNNAIDKRCNEMIEEIENHKRRLKIKIKEEHEKKVKINFSIDWKKLKDDISDDYNTCFHNVVAKITRYKFKLNEIIKNSFEELNEENLNINKNETLKNLNNLLKEDFNKKQPDMQPIFTALFCGIYIKSLFRS